MEGGHLDRVADAADRESSAPQKFCLNIHNSVGREFKICRDLIAFVPFLLQSFVSNSVRFFAAILFCNKFVNIRKRDTVLP